VNQVSAPHTIASQAEDAAKAVHALSPWIKLHIERPSGIEPESSPLDRTRRPEGVDEPGRMGVPNQANAP
jgi:hypothetical protein